MGLREAGIDKSSQQHIDAIRKLARIRLTDSPNISQAIDAYLFSFYQAGMPIEQVIAMKADDPVIEELPQTVAIRRRYAASARKYLFPLRQWQRTAKQIQKSLESNIKMVFTAYNIESGDNTIAEFMAETWIATAKSCGVAIPDIYACCRTAVTDAVRPSLLSTEQRQTIKRKVANAIVDMERHWYAVRFNGDEARVRQAIADIASDDDIRIYYPQEEIYKKVGNKRIIEERPTIRNIMFVQMLPDTLDDIVKAKPQERGFYIIKNSATSGHDYAIISNEEMRRFSAMVSNGLDILSDDDMKHVEILEGSYVQITDGPYAGFCGQVLKVRNKDNAHMTMLQIEADKFGPELGQILGKHLYITIPQAIVAHHD
jgi:transcription antitermination factor NusG